MRITRHLSVAAAILIASLAFLDRAEACGCFHPPIPDEFEDDFAVNQTAEQIIFEVGDGTITAHVLIQYAGDPAAFAWLVPVPSAPELALSHSGVFSWLGDATAPYTTWSNTFNCPTPAYSCRRHPAPRCPPAPWDPGCDEHPVQDSGMWADTTEDASEDWNGPGDPPVEVVSREQVGSYDTVVFAADEADLAIGWLQDEGFIVNDTMTPFMQPYLDSDMLFLASRLVAGADVDEIRPLRMTFEADNPMIPLQLTAIAADPHLAIISYVVGDSTFEPIEQPITEVDGAEFAVDALGRINYPMLLSRTIDEAGGNAFVVEYAGAMPANRLGDSQCCGQGYDLCEAGHDGLCQCPLDDWDQEDCAEVPDLEALTEGIQRVSAYPYVTRLTTRVSPHEMTFDPMFRPTEELTVVRRRTYNASRPNIDDCSDDIVNPDAWDDFDATSACASVYCGAGTCAVSGEVAGCVCDEGQVGRTFRDLDGEISVTCVPETPMVDFAAGGLVLKSACEDDDGSCVDIGGFVGRRCAEGEIAAVGLGPVCLPITHEVDAGAGGSDRHSELLDAIEICVPAPPSDCGTYGWLVYEEPRSPFAVMCDQSQADPALLEIPPPQPEPECPDYSDWEPTDCSDAGDWRTDAANGGDSSSSGNDESGNRGSDRGCAVSRTRGSAAWLLGLCVLLTRRRRRS